MSQEERYYRQPWMSDDQWRAAECVASCVGGHHHMKTPKPCGKGIRVGIHTHNAATYDFSLMTRLVVAAHDNCVRLALCCAGMRLAVEAHVRVRDGMMHERHPTLEENVAAIRGGK